MLATPIWSQLSGIPNTMFPVFQGSLTPCQTNMTDDKELCQSKPSWPLNIDFVKGSFLAPPIERPLDYLSTSVPMEGTPFLLPDMDFGAITRRPSTDALRPRIGDVKPLQFLKDKLETREFWRSKEELLWNMQESFAIELNYLKSAYATSYPAGATTSTRSPSKVLNDGLGFPEIDRTLTGIVALYWIYKGDYASFTRHQNPAIKLTKKSFNQLCDFYDTHLQGFSDVDKLAELIVMQMTNDLGKSTQLQREYQREGSGVLPSANHDAFMGQVLASTPKLIPSIHNLKESSKYTVHLLTKLSAEFSPPQLVQGECSPKSLEALQAVQYSASDINLKFMELFLDLSGAAGHMNHEGAISMTEPVYRSMAKALEVSLDVAAKSISPQQGYVEMMEFRFDYINSRASDLYGTQLSGDFTEWNDNDIAVARILSMGRVADQHTASLYLNAINNLAEDVQRDLVLGLGTYSLHRDGDGNFYGVQPTYFPSLLALVKDIDERKWQAKIEALLGFPAHVVCVKETEYARICEAWGSHPLRSVSILERDVRDRDEVLASAAFKENPSVAALLRGGLSGVQVAKKKSRIARV